VASASARSERHRIARLLTLVSIAIAEAAAPAAAQVSAMVPKGKAAEYRAVDDDTGEAIIDRLKVWSGTDAGQAVIWTEAAFPNGDRMVAECFKGNGTDKPATARLSLLTDWAGKVEGTEFQTFEPSYYPFLHRPLPTQPLEAAACFTAAGLDIAALQRGEEASLYMWVNDAVYFRLIFRIIGKETITVPAGKYEAWRLRSSLDLATLFPDLPRWVTGVMRIFAPDVSVWVSADPSRTMLKLSGLGLGDHRHAAEELISTGDPPPSPPAGAELLRRARYAPPDPQTTIENSGTFTVGALQGRATMSSAKIDGSNELLLVRTEFRDRLAIEARSVISHASSPHALYMEQRTYAPKGDLVQRRYLKLDAGAFPLRHALQIPDDLFAESLTLGEVLPTQLPSGANESRFHIIGFDGNLNELRMWQAGEGTPAQGGAQTKGLRMKLRPVVNLPVYLRPIAYFLIPTFDFDLQDLPPHRLLQFTGPFGPPGSPDTHFVADASPPTNAAEAR
jgi:hypothetical protein